MSYPHPHDPYRYDATAGHQRRLTELRRELAATEAQILWAHQRGPDALTSLEILQARANYLRVQIKRVVTELILKQ